MPHFGSNPALSQVCVLFLHVCVCVCRQFETVIPVEDSVITEMTSTLRDWGAMWKQLYVVRSHTHTHTLFTSILNITAAFFGLKIICFALGNSKAANCFVFFPPTHSLVELIVFAAY